MTITAHDTEDAVKVDGFYLIGEERFRSVTSALEKWGKEELKGWASWLAASSAADELPRLVAAMLTPDCGRTWHPKCQDHDWVERCPNCRCDKCTPCMTRWLSERHRAESRRRADEGGRVHHLVKHWVLTGVWLEPDEDIRVYVASFKAFVAEYGLVNTDWEMAEARVVNRSFMYAGTLDAAIHFHRDRSKAAADLLDRFTPDGADRVQHALVLADYKTKEKEERGIYEDHPLQLSGYRYAESIVLPDGTEVPMLKVDAAVIIQIRPDKTVAEPVLAEEPEFAAFLNILGADQWGQERAKTATAKNTFAYAPSVAKMRAADQRRARKERDAAAPAEVPPPDAPEPTPAERGARAAAAVHQPDAGQVWRDLANQHGAGPGGKRARSEAPRGRKVETATAAVLGAPGRPGDEEPPF